MAKHTEAERRQARVKAERLAAKIRQLPPATQRKFELIAEAMLEADPADASKVLRMADQDPPDLKGMMAWATDVLQKRR